jgi:superfamily II DNA or RNA helicase
VAILAISEAEESVRRLVGTDVFLRGRAHVEREAVTAVSGSLRAGQLLGEVREPAVGHSTMLRVEPPDVDGQLAALRSTCTCRSPGTCDHAVAVLLVAVQRAPQAASSTQPVPRTPTGPAPWERALISAIRRPSTAAEPTTAAPVALQFEVTPDGRGARPSAPARIGLRPVLPGRSSAWVRSGISWANLAWHQSRLRGAAAKRQLRLLHELLLLATDPKTMYYGYGRENVLWLETVPTRRVWDLLGEATEAGLPLVQADRHGSPVVVCSAGATPALHVRRTDAGLELAARLEAGDRPVPGDSLLLLGRPRHGVAWWDPTPSSSGATRSLRLAPIVSHLDEGLEALLHAEPVAIPRSDERRFLTEYYPALRRRLPLVATDGSVDLPAPAPPVLSATVHRLPDHRLQVEWSWLYRVGDVEHEQPLWSVSPSVADDRDAAAEAAVLRAVEPLVEPVPELFEPSPMGRRLAAHAELAAMATVRLLEGVVPALTDAPDIEVTVDLSALPDGGPMYRAAQELPVVRFAGAAAEHDPDWFDLAVEVSVEGEQVPFELLFRALAEGQEHLLLPSGTYLTLDQPQLRQLAALIAEARALQDAAPQTIRLSRFQAGLWDELEQLGVVHGQARVWQESVQALAQAPDADPPPAPIGLIATLRPYQRAGFAWLAALYERRLGGVLADDMGLGKTLQAMALMCHVREHQTGSRAPFLVVAPTSVVSTWVGEMGRFAPSLRVAAVTETGKRRSSGLEQLAVEADVVVTSYTLFRLEYDEYAAVTWAGLVLDEAQFVKNHQSLAYQCARKLPTPFKLAVTGTPMENNLMELWALLSITAPGLFPSPQRFTEYYRWPIERAKDGDLLAQLRRRIRPLLLRRTKGQVVHDLPEKQEQVIELPLVSQHRRVYQTYLQRERQKVLGLLGDLNRNRLEIFRSLTLLRQASLHVGLVDPEHAHVPSTKLDAFLEQITEIVAEGHRTLVFSQFTRFLQAARDRVTTAGIEHCYLDGRTRKRQAQIDRFKTGDAPVFFISLKAGGFGLNLTEADYCILLDPWWNPASEAQAVDRVHRIGQARRVMVYRLVAQDTIEEKVMALKARKAELFDSVLGDAGFASAAALTAADVRSLLE